MWQYVAVPASPRKTKKMTFLKRFFLGWRCVAICGGTGIATEKKKITFLFFFPLVAMCGNTWRYRYHHGKQKNDFCNVFFIWWRCVAIRGGTGYRYRNGKQKNDVVLNFFPLVAMCGNTVSPRKKKKNPLVAMCGNTWRYRIATEIQKSWFFQIFLG